MIVRGRNGSVRSLVLWTACPHLSLPETPLIRFGFPQRRRRGGAQFLDIEADVDEDEDEEEEEGEEGFVANGESLALSLSRALGRPERTEFSSTPPHTALQTISSSNAKHGGTATARSVRQAPMTATMPISPRATLTATRRTVGSTGGGWPRRIKRQQSWPPS